MAHTGTNEYTGFTCPDCASPGSLQIQHIIQFQGDSRSDDIILQTIACSTCRFEGIAVYQESRRGTLDSESWDHYGYCLDAEDQRTLRNLIAECPTPVDSSCGCRAHLELGITGSEGRWNGLAGFDLRNRFEMQLVTR